MKFRTVEIGGKSFDLNDEFAVMPWDFIQEWDEARIWHARFLLFKDIAPDRRTVREIWRLHVEKSKEEGTIYHRKFASASWQNHAKRGFWFERAAAWDDWVRHNDERDRVAVNRERLREICERDWKEATNIRDKMLKALDLVSLVIMQREVVAERWLEGETIRPGDPKVIIRPVRLRVPPDQLAKALILLSDLQRRSAVGAGDEDKATETTALDASDRPQTWEAHVLSTKIDRLNEVISEKDAEIVRLRQMLAMQ